MAKTFKSLEQIKVDIEQRCSIAVEKTCERLLEVLQQMIMDEYYDRYTPIQYQRTLQFYESAIKQMLSKLSGAVIMNPHLMHYDGNWSGEIQLKEANVGSHGGIDVGGSYWNEFLKYCDANCFSILKEEIRKAGVAVR